MRKTPFTSADAMVATGIAVVTLALVASILLSAEHVKRASAESIVEAVAAANQRRLSAGKPLVTGSIDDGNPLVVDGEIEPQEWENLPYAFVGAEQARDACILAVATRRSDGRWGTARAPYSRWGICATAKGEVAPFEDACTLDCKEPEPPPAPPPPPPPAPVATPVARPSRPIKVDMPDLGPDREPPKKKGCSVTGCFGTTCCDEATDACMSCPGASCCTSEKLGCSGICQSDDDCTIGCGCVKLPGSPTGNCRGK